MNNPIKYLALIMVLITASCEDPSSSNNPTSSNSESKSSSSGSAIIQFDNPTHDFGPIWDIDEQSHSFSFKNTGNKTLEIFTVKASCGCTTPKLDIKEYAPGETGELTLSFKPKGFGTQQKNLTITSNAANAPTQKLTIKATISPFVRISPSRVNFNAIESSTGAIATVRLSPTDPGMKILKVMPKGQNAKFLRATLLPRTSGPTIAGSNNNDFQIEIELLPGGRWGDFYGSFEVDVAGKIPGKNKNVEHTYSIPTNAKIFNTIKADNTMFQIGPAKPNTPVRKQLTLRRFDGLPFVINSANATGTTLKSHVVQTSVPFGTTSEKHTLTLVGTSDNNLNKAMGGFVIVQTDVEGDEKMQFRIAGIVR